MSDTPRSSTSAEEDLLNELAALTTEEVSERLRELDTLSTGELLHTMNAMDHEVPGAVERVLPEIVAVVDATTERLRRGGRLLYLGAGTPGRLGILDASECPPTFSTDPGLVVGIIAGGDRAIRTAVENAEDDPEGGALDLADFELGEQDVVVGISASGRTPYVAGGLQYARERGALTVALACNAGSVIGRIADHAIEVVVGPELIAGSTRLKAGTAQKLVLNMISTGTMVRLGKTFGNVMVDLHATNQKLRARSQRAVMLITGCTAEQAVDALRETAGSVKEAVLVLLGSLSPAQAHVTLAHTTGLREALELRAVSSTGLAERI